MNTKKFHLIIISLFLIIILNSKPLSVLAKTCSEAKGICYDATVCDSLGINGWYTDPTAECPPPYVCCVQFTGNEEETEDTNKTGLPKEIQSPTSVIPYEFETGIPGIVGAGQSLQRMTLAEFVKLLIRYIFRISGILAFVMIVYGGILYLISGGDAKKQKSAQETIAGAVIGLILLFAFWLILNTINPDILRAPKISVNPPSPTTSTSTTPTSGPPSNNSLANQIIQEANSRNIKFFYNYFLNSGDWTKQDLLDTANNKKISPADTAGKFSQWQDCDGNGTKETDCNKATNKVKNLPSTTIDSNLLKSLLIIFDEFDKWQTDPESPNCRITEIGPFIRGHFYCCSTEFMHEKGKAVDITIGGDPSCAKYFSQYLCGKGGPGIWCTPLNTSLKQLGLSIYNEYGGYETLEGEPHLHIQVP